MRRRSTMAVLALGVVVLGCASVETRGRTVYDLHCVMCHGGSGRGDGYFADQLLLLPPDLTLLARDNGGTFPAMRVRASIVGEGRAAHFSGAMPDFADLDVSGIAPDSQLEAVVAYLESIQQ